MPFSIRRWVLKTVLNTLLKVLTIQFKKKVLTMSTERILQPSKLFLSLKVFTCRISIAFFVLVFLDNIFHKYIIFIVLQHTVCIIKFEIIYLIFANFFFCWSQSLAIVITKMFPTDHTYFIHAWVLQTYHYYIYYSKKKT
jgi:hypothetical protein